MPQNRQDTKGLQQGSLIKAHLVFESISQELISEISRYCVITHVHNSIEEACRWTADNRGTFPDLFLINCSRCFSGDKKISAVKNRLALFNRLHEIIRNSPNSRLVLLIPEFMANDLSLLSTLLKLRIYNPWFVDSFDGVDIHKFLSVNRTQAELEKYIREKEAIQSLNKSSIFQRNKLDKIYRPYYVKSNVIAFWSPDEGLLNHAVAVLTAFKLARSGFKVALIEGISSIPRLAHSLQLEHPYFNTRHAFLMYSSNNTDFATKCIFNAEKYLDDTYSLQREEYVSRYPGELYFLPDRSLGGEAENENTDRNWEGFITSLIRTTIYEQNFNFVIFILNGITDKNDFILNELTNIKFLSVTLDPGGIIFAQQEDIKKGGNLHIIAYRHLENNSINFAEFFEKPLIFAPTIFKQDFLMFVYNKDFRKISSETHEFIKILAGHSGVNISDYKPIKETKGILHKLISIKPGG